jgi:hypothetical protein
MLVHVVPNGDLIEHELTDECPCGPASELRQTPDGDGWLIIHDSLDGREAREVVSGGRPLSWLVLTLAEG